MPKKEEQPKAVEPEQVAGQPVIQTIPDKFYGAALKAKLRTPEEKEKMPKKEAPPPGSKKGVGVGVIILIVLLLLGGAGAGFVYFNQELIFGPPAEEEPEPAPEPPQPPPPPPPPAAPTNLNATATSPSVVQLNWTDEANNEAGFRVERREPATEYRSVTSLPPNASGYQDRSVRAESTYLYRVIALNEGGESPFSNEVSVDTPEEPPPPPEPVKLPPAGLDSDSDGLTDLEEPLYGTSPRDPDADKDTFLDGNEVFHLYNPAGGVSVRLLESGLVKPFESPVGWKVFVPTTWKVELSEDGMEGKIITGHGETFTLSMERNPAGQELMDWYLSRHPGTLSSDVASITTKSGISGLEGADLLTTYFLWGDVVLMFKYNLMDQPFVNFRQTYEMMKNSLMLSPIPAIPEGAMMEEEKELPVPAATTTEQDAEEAPAEGAEEEEPASGEGQDAGEGGDGEGTSEAGSTTTEGGTES